MEKKVHYVREWCDVCNKEMDFTWGPDMRLGGPPNPNTWVWADSLGHVNDKIPWPGFTRGKIEP